MTDEEKAELKAGLQKELARFEEVVTSLEQDSGPVKPDVSLGRLTRMDAIQQQSMSRANLEQSREKIAAIKNQLAMIDRPGFGLCAACGQPIPLARLEAVPGTGHCVNCA